MIGTELAGSEWGEYLETVSLVCSGMPTTVEALDASARAKRCRRRTGRRLRELRLDEQEGLLEVALGGGCEGPALRCYLHSPRAIIPCERGAYHSMIVLDASGAATLIAIEGEGS